MRRQSAISCKDYWIQPKLAFTFTAADVNVRRLASLVGVKVKSIRANA